MTSEKDCALMGRQEAIRRNTLGEFDHSSVRNQLEIGWGEFL